jgi:NTP pyrophosphatase (non-canonical NTP hydrolase)
MNFDEYQEAARKTAIYPNVGNNIIYPCLGLAGETGEICENVKKILRDKNGIISDKDKEAIKKELGDQLWYVAALCSEFGFSMSEVVECNIAKLQSRKERGKLSGNGDNR